jgi:ATP-dependent RNA helicase DOB1
MKARFKDDFPLLDPIEDMEIKDSGIVDIIKRIKTVEDQVVSHPLHKDPSLQQLYERYEKKEQVGNVKNLLFRLIN